jgi:hypothetical protein
MYWYEVAMSNINDYHIQMEIHISDIYCYEVDFIL